MSLDVDRLLFSFVTSSSNRLSRIRRWISKWIVCRFWSLVLCTSILLIGVLYGFQLWVVRLQIVGQSSLLYVDYDTIQHTHLPSTCRILMCFDVCDALQRQLAECMCTASTWWLFDALGLLLVDCIADPKSRWVLMDWKQPVNQTMKNKFVVSSFKYCSSLKTSINLYPVTEEANIHISK